MPEIPTYQSKTSAATGVSGLSPTRTAAGFARAAGNVDQIAYTMAKAEAERQRAKDSANMSRALIETEEGLAQLYGAAVESPDFEASTDLFRNGALELIAQKSESFTNEEQLLDFQLRATRKAGTFGLQVNANARRLRTAQEKDDWNALVEQTAMNSAALLEGDQAGRDLFYDDLLVQGETKAADGTITDLDREMQKYLARSDHYRTTTMSQQDPARLKELLAERNEDGSWVNFTHLNDQQRPKAVQSADAGIATHKRLDREDQTAAVKAADQMFYRGLNPENGVPMMTINELWDHPLVTNKPAKAEILRNYSTGHYDDRTNNMIYNPLHLRAMAGDETALVDAQSLLGKGTRTEDLDRLEAILKRGAEDPVVKENQRQLAAAMTLFKSQIEEGIGGKSAEGSARYLNYIADVQEAVAKGLEEGKTLASMLDPGPPDNPNPDYVLDPQNYIRTRRERFQEKRDIRLRDRKRDEENAERTAKPDMSPSEYIKSIQK